MHIRKKEPGTLILPAAVILKHMPSVSKDSGSGEPCPCINLCLGNPLGINGNVSG